jgi:hypothetical protein
MKKAEKLRPHVLILIGCVIMMSACSDATTPASIRGYNHMKDLSIHIFTVNGASGPNVRPESGGGETCCVSLPQNWRPGLKAKVSWEYDQKEDAPRPLPEKQKAEVDIPPYPFGGSLQVHFYAKHKVKIVISPCSPAHPFYPLTGSDLAPWEPSFTKEDAREAAQRGGGSVDC